MPDNPRAQPPIQSVARAIAILRCFNGNAELGLTEISRRLGLHKSTTAGIINTLKAEGFLEQNERTGKLRLGLELFSLAVQARRSLNEICGPYLDQLLEATGETVNLAVLDKTEIVYIAKKESPHSVRISTSIGARLPLHCTAIGKVVLAYMDRARAEALLDRIDQKPFTEQTITSRGPLLEEMDHIAREGMAYDFEEYEPGVICVAAPLYAGRRDPIGAVSVSGPSTRMKGEALTRHAATLCGVTQRIRAELLRFDEI